MVCDDVGCHDGDGCSIDRDGGDYCYCCRYYWHWRGWDRRLKWAWYDDDGVLSCLSRFRSDVYAIIDTSQ